MPMILLPRTRVALGITRNNFPRLIARANAVQSAIAANTEQIPAANPTPAVLLTQIQTLEAAQQRTNGKQPGASADRNAAAAVVRTSLDGICIYVQSLCDASPEKAAQLVAASSMKTVASTSVQKPILSATLGVASGSVELRANKQELVGKTSAMCAFHWEYSIDGQKTWVAVLGTPLAQTTVTGLPALATVWFRVSVTMKKETGPCCQPVSIIVH